MHVQEKIEFWTNVWGFTMAPIRKMALQEPLVDTVSEELVVTSVANLCSININTMTEDHIPFSATFDLVVRRDDHLHAIALWFDVYFDSSHKKVCVLIVFGFIPRLFGKIRQVCGK
jgi:protein arginine N-methyltransferase 1